VTMRRIGAAEDRIKNFALWRKQSEICESTSDGFLLAKRRGEKIQITNSFCIPEACDGESRRALA